MVSFMSDKRKKGQALVEFALGLPLLVLLVFGVLDFGRAFQTKIVLTNAAREGIHYFFYHPDDRTNGFADTRLAVRHEVTQSGVELDASDNVIDIFCYDDADADGQVDATDTDSDGVPDTGGEIDASCNSGSTIVVTVEKNFYLSVVGSFFDPIPIHSDARMLVP